MHPARRVRLPAWLALVLAAGALALLSGAAAASQRVSFRTDDGVTIAGTWYEPSSRPAPAVILVHMLQKSRRDWDQTASRLAGEGLAVLTFDLRGHGESTGNAQDMQGMVQDVRAARRFIATRSDALPSRVGIAGASLGATLAALAAADDPAIASLALLSPSTDYRGLRIEPAVRKYGGRPLLLVASDDDGYALRSVKELQKSGGGARETVVLSHAGHGTAMLASEEDLGRRLLEWFRRTLL
ncbi:MAG TPA: alpha/beta fold hydrolase [Vicinamibacterales bacterium]|nr:alpha/beta fold hydrolase [Vicinamibacterales bacterium]